LCPLNKTLNKTREVHSDIFNKLGVIVNKNNWSLQTCLKWRFPNYRQEYIRTLKGKCALHIDAHNVLLSMFRKKTLFIPWLIIMFPIYCNRQNNKSDAFPTPTSRVCRRQWLPLRRTTKVVKKIENVCLKISIKQSLLTRSTSRSTLCLLIKWLSQCWLNQGP